MSLKSFQELKVWQKSHDLSLKIYKETRNFPSDEKYGIISQLRRAATSIPANICEGYMKSTKEFVRFIEISRGSLEETKYFLILSKDLGFLSKSKFNELMENADEIGKMLYGLKEKLLLKLTTGRTTGHRPLTTS